MSDFSTQWKTAQQSESREDAPPPAGLYEVALKDAKAFVSKAGNEVVVFEFKAFAPAAYADHVWSSVYTWGKTPPWLIRKEFVALGADVESVERFEDLDTALKPCIGRYYEVEVEQKGKYSNTYVQRAITLEDAGPSEIPVEMPEPAAAGAKNSDDDIPW